MRTQLGWIAVAAGVMLGPTAAHSQEETGPVAGRYQVQFAEVANSCSAQRLSLSGVTIRLAETGGDGITVELPGVPTMTGTHGRAGKFRAMAGGEVAQKDGAAGKFSAAGRATRDRIQLLFIAEFYRDGKPLCTQTWNGSGKRQE